MKTILLTLTMAIGFTGVSLAQNHEKTVCPKKEARKDQTPEERSKHEAQKAAKQLGLTAQQQTDWEVATFKRTTANQPLHDKMQGSTTPEERKTIHQQVKANNDAFETTVSAFLTAEQKTKMEEIKKEKHEMHKSRKHLDGKIEK